jgi:FlaG/FlaF family flagellin (archaellin)
VSERIEEPTLDRAETEVEDRTVAVLLALAAVVGIVLGGRASLVRSSATDAWQGALRQEIKRAAGAVEDVRYVYTSEAPIAFQVDEAKIRATEARRAAARATGLTKRVLLLEANTLSLFAKNLGGASKRGWRTRDTARRMAGSTPPAGWPTNASGSRTWSQSTPSATSATATASAGMRSTK